MGRSEAEIELTTRDELLESVIASLERQPSADELERLTQVLAELHRLHAGQLAIRDMETDLVDIAHLAVDAVRRRTADRHLLLRTAPHASVICDPARMRQLLDELLEESVRRTADGARIELRLEMATTRLAQLTLRSEACGDDRPAGPVLHLCRALVQRQGGTFRSTVSPGGSLEVIVTLPGSPRPPRRGVGFTRRHARP